MDYIFRKIENKIRTTLKRGKSVLLLGPRQTGKTTLIRRLESDLFISLINPRTRLRYEKDPGLLADEIRAVATEKKNIPVIILDEVQKVPVLMDVAQELIDEKIAIFVLTGSSARKLRRDGPVNLLPGRVITVHMDPLTLIECEMLKESIYDRLIFGSLPEASTTRDENYREDLLESYVTTYLEEEIRAEAVVRNLAQFARFLELAAGESGHQVNFTRLSQALGIAHSTISAYYQILEDCLIAERVEPLIESNFRRRLVKTQKYLFFDLGVRRIAAGEGKRLSKERMGYLFEHFVGLELIHLARLQKEKAVICFWRDLDGPEVDWVIKQSNSLIPIEVKWTDSPRIQDAKHLNLFIKEYAEAEKGIIICQTPLKMQLSEQIWAYPWQSIPELFSSEDSDLL